MTQRQKMYFEKVRIPKYSKGEEVFNYLSHFLGLLMSVVALVFMMRLAISKHIDAKGTIALMTYGLSGIILYFSSTIYHYLSEDTILKKVFRIIDHCTIYLLIAGTYTPICILVLNNSRILLLEWLVCFVGIILNTFWLNKRIVKIISIFLYIFLGWLIVFIPNGVNSLSDSMFAYILTGGIMYSIGVIFYGLGKNIKWSHSVFHIFCLLGTIIQFMGIILMIK